MIVLVPEVPSAPPAIDRPRKRVRFSDQHESEEEEDLTAPVRTLLPDAGQALSPAAGMHVTLMRHAGAFLLPWARLAPFFTVHDLSIDHADDEEADEREYKPGKPHAPMLECCIPVQRGVISKRMEPTMTTGIHPGGISRAYNLFFLLFNPSGIACHCRLRRPRQGR